MAAKQKLLLVFELENVLFKYNRKDVITLSTIAQPEGLTYRRDLDELLKFLFIRVKYIQNKSFFNVGVWTSRSAETTEKQCKIVFGRFMPK